MRPNKKEKEIHNLQGPRQALKAKYNSGPRSLSCARRSQARRMEARASQGVSSSPVPGLDEAEHDPAGTRSGPCRCGAHEQWSCLPSRARCGSRAGKSARLRTGMDRFRNELAAHAQQCGQTASLGSMSSSNRQGYRHWRDLPSRRHGRAPAKPAWLSCAMGHRRHCLGCLLAAG